MSRDKIFEHTQPFAEVGSNWPLDNFARRFCHQTAHPGELLYLLAVAPGAGVLHQVHRVKFLTALVVLKGPEHHVGNFFTGLGPDVDDLVVALAIGNDTAAVLLLHQRDLLVSLVQLRLLFIRDNHIGNADRYPRLGGPIKPEFLQPIQSFDGLLLSGNLIGAPDDIT